MSCKGSLLCIIDNYVYRIQYKTCHKMRIGRVSCVLFAHVLYAPFVVA
jgi:hypothetical protein